MAERLPLYAVCPLWAGAGYARMGTNTCDEGEAMRPNTLTVAEQRAAAKDAVLFGGPYNVLDGGTTVVSRYLPEKCLDWHWYERDTALLAVTERASKLAQTIINRYS